MIGSMGKGIYWAMLVAVFGLMQLWINLGYLLYHQSDSLSFYILAKDGALLFFTLAITTGVTVDFFFQAHGRGPMSIAKASAFVFYPLIIMAFTVSAYMIPLRSPAAGKEATIELLNCVVIAMTAAYAILAKAYMFFAERRA